MGGADTGVRGIHEESTDHGSTGCLGEPDRSIKDDAVPPGGDEDEEDGEDDQETDEWEECFFPPPDVS